MTVLAKRHARLDHLASKWNRSPESLGADIERSIRQGANVISCTEVADGKRWQALQVDGWTTCQDRDPWQAGESAILVDDSFGDVLEWHTEQIGPDLGPGNAVYAVVAIVEIRDTGKILLVADAHLPSSVESKWKHRRGAEFRKMVHNYKRLVRRFRKKWKPDAECVWADWNLNLNLAWVRAWARSLWARRKTLGKRKTPGRGSHGNRLIDWPVTHGLRRRKLTVLPLTAGSDHRGVRLDAETS